MGVAVAAGVFFLKIGDQVLGEGNIEFVSLAAVAEVGGALIVHSSLPGFLMKILCGIFFQGCEFLGDAGVRKFIGTDAQDGAGIILDHIADQNAESGESAGEGGDDYLRDAKGFREGGRVKATGATESDEGKVAGIAAALDGDDADGFLHRGVDDADHASGKGFESERTSLLLQPFASDAAGAVEIEGEVSAEKSFGLQAAEQKVGVGDGGLGAASVADGARIGTGGFRADAQDAAGIEAGERASAGADGVDIEHGDADGESGDLGVGGGGGGAVY